MLTHLGKLNSLESHLFHYLGERIYLWRRMADSPTNLDPMAVLSALANAQRLDMVSRMSRGETLTINGLVETTGRSYKAVHKDLGILLAAGVVAVAYGGDKRVGLFSVPAPYRSQPGVVDFGFCAVRFGAGAAVAATVPAAPE
jgi:hypothetical protein